MTRKRPRLVLASAIGVATFVLLMCNSALAMDGVRRGLSLCTETLIPALFPFLVLSELFVACGAGEMLGRFLGKPLSVLFGISRGGACAVLLGALCGQPVASASGLSLCERGEISPAELERISLFANNPSSAFLTAAVGGAIFGNKSAGAALFFITLFSSLLVGVGLRIFCGKVDISSKKAPNGMRKAFGAADITGGIKRAFFTLLQVCAFLLFFCALAACLDAPLRNTAPFWRVLLCGTLEITGGISAAASTLPPLTAFRLTTFFSSFAGLSVCLQILSITEGKRLRLSHYLLAKLSQGGIALALCEGYLYFFHPVLSPTSSVPTLSPNTQLSWFMILLLLLVLSFCLLAKNRERKTP